ncbi:Protein of unknown function [Gryllus bimaculatus]|nr:Protein of unknown function [Gryllus bimaculatus]
MSCEQRRWVSEGIVALRCRMGPGRAELEERAGADWCELVQVGAGGSGLEGTGTVRTSGVAAAAAVAPPHGAAAPAVVAAADAAAAATAPRAASTVPRPARRAPPPPPAAAAAAAARQPVLDGEAYGVRVA